MKKYLLLCFLTLGVTVFAQTKPVEKPNILFIAVDDLRPELGCYGVEEIKSPNIDALAKSGLLFNRAYCQQAVCSPSRTSLMTGRRPDTTKVYNLQDHFRETIPNVITLTEHFKNNGYFAQSFGKIYHPGLDDPKSWSVPGFSSGGGTGKSLKKGQKVQKAEPWSAPDVPDNALPDGQTADEAIQVLNNVKDKPFFIAVGFKKPHLPFIAPKKYYDLYRVEDMKLAKNPFPPKDIFPIALSDWGELRGYKNIPKEGPVPDELARELKRGYYAATSYTDAQIGRVLDELKKLGLREKTIVILWGDHGWQLGEHG
jgi:arylsulfatase A-like enzyme